jgi:hypothetical protein
MDLYTHKDAVTGTFAQEALGRPRVRRMADGLCGSYNRPISAKITTISNTRPNPPLG